jgi:hypothetical protein
MFDRCGVIIKDIKFFYAESFYIVMIHELAYPVPVDHNIL